MKRSIWVWACLCAAIAVVGENAMGQDNPVAGFGTAGGNNARTFVYAAPIGAPDTVKWKQNLQTAYNTRRNARGCIVFDENGDLYFTGGFNAAVANSGIIKVKASDGSLLWASPLLDTIFSQITPIVGADAAYSARSSDANPTIYALNKSTGAVVWESAPLPKRVLLNMALYNGVIYGVTIRDATAGASYVFAVQASNGAVLHATPISTVADIDNFNVALVPNLFGAGEHGLYWTHDANTPNNAMYCVQVSTATASLKWAQTPARTAVSHIVYNAAKNAIYNFHWSDYGSSVEAYDPVTGAKRWVGRTAEFGGSFSGGFYPTHTLKPDGSGFILAGFNGDLHSMTDPGDLAGGNLTLANRDWVYDGPDPLGESQTLAALVVQGEHQVFISGTTGNAGANSARRMFVQDAIGGGRLATWLPPGDPSPLVNGFNMRSLSVGPDGTIYYMNAEDGAHGSLYAVSIRPFVAPVIAEVSPDPDTAAVFTEYTRQLETSGGDPAGRWAVAAGPPGLQVDNSGRVFGWTPVKEDMGDPITITIEAINPGGSGSETWTVTVVDPLSGLTIKERTAPVAGSSATSMASDGLALYYHDNNDGTLYRSADATGWTQMTGAPGAAPENYNAGALAYYNGKLYTRRSDGTDPVLTVYDIATDTWSQHGQRLFGHTGFTVVGSKLYGNSHAAKQDQGGHLTIADLTNVDAATCTRAQVGGLTGNDSDWFSRVVQLASLDGKLYGIKNDWVTQPRGTGDRLWTVDPATLLINFYIGPNWNDWDHAISTGTDLGMLPFEPGYGSALVAVPAGWAGVVGAQGGLFIVAGRSPSNHEGFGESASDRFAVYDIATGKFMGGALPAVTGSGTSATFHNGQVYVKRGGDPDILFSDQVWVIGPFQADRADPDLDNNGHVDGADFDLLITCLTGPSIPYTTLPAGCGFPRDFEGVIQPDFDRDGDVDQTDFGVFQKCFSGPDAAFDPACVD